MRHWFFIFVVTCLLTLLQVQAQNPSAVAKEVVGAPSTVGQPENKRPDLIFTEENELVIRGWQVA